MARTTRWRGLSTLAVLFPGMLALPAAAAPGDQSAITDRTISDSVPHLLNNPVFITFKVNDADVRAVLQYLASKGGMNVMLDDSVTGKISLDLKAVPTDEALSLVLKLRGLKAVRVGSTLLIASEATFDKKNFGNQETVAIRVNNAVATDLIDKIKDVVPTDTKIIADARTNSIILQGTDETIAKAKAMIRALDIPAPQVLIEVRMIELSPTANSNLSFFYNLNGGKTSSSYSSTGTTVTFDPLENLTGLFNAQLQALISKGEAQITAAPRILVQDNIQAQIRLVNQIPYITTTYVPSGGTTIPTQQVNFVNVGQTLSITPRIDSDGYVTMQLNPDITVQAPAVPGIQVPVVNDRNVQTTLRVKDGETVIIGGLFRKETSNSSSQIPILGDIPFLGTLFRQNSSTDNQSDIVIEVTPHIASKVYGDINGLPALNNAGGGEQQGP